MAHELTSDTYGWAPTARAHGFGGAAAFGVVSSAVTPGRPSSSNESQPAASGAKVVEDDDEETFFERVANSPLVQRVSVLAGRVFQNYTVAVALDVVGVLLFMFDIYTDALVVVALSKDAEHRTWMIITLVFILWHYVLTAVLVTAYLKRTTTKVNVLGLEEGDASAGVAAVLEPRRRYRWLLFVPVAVLGVVALDVAMLFTSILPILFPRLFASFSSFLSNYNFSRFFIEFVFESIPQTVLQTYIYYHLANSKLAGSAQQRTIALSLTVSALNCLKYGWKLYKAADDAGLTLTEYFKYLLLLKGNYECSPSTMLAVINECCSLRRNLVTPCSAGTAAASSKINANLQVVTPRAGDTVGDYASVSAPNGGAGSSFIMNGFHLHRNKSQYGPAQQAYILLNAFDRIDGCEGVRRWVVSGCPLASINRILEKGIRAFRNLETLEVNECALRGDTWKLVTRAIKRHKKLDKVKLIQTGILTKYRNAKRRKVVSGVFKHSLGLRAVALCLSWWNEEYLQIAVDQYILDHPTLECLAIELPPGAAFAFRSLGSTEVRAVHDGSHSGRAPLYGVGHAASLRPSGGAGDDRSWAKAWASRCSASPLAAVPVPRRRLEEMANGPAGGGTVFAGGGSAVAAASAAPRSRRNAFGGVTSGTASGFLSPFATDQSAAAAAASGNSAATSAGGGSGVARALLGLFQQGGGVLTDFASYVSDGAATTLQGLAAVAAGQPWSASGGSNATAAVAAAAAGVASPRYCWLLASVVVSAPALRALYIHNHALPEAAAEGVGQLAAALAGNTRLTTLSLRGSTVGDAGAVALARVLSGQNSSLQVLNLRRCKLHDEGVGALCSMLVENRGLRSLDLSHNRVQGGVMQHVEAHAAPMAAAAVTGLGGHANSGGVCSAGNRLAGLERALRLNTSLRELRLEGWRDTFDDPQVVASLAASLSANEGLHILSLAGCCITSRGAAALAAALAAHTTLTTLNLAASANDATAGGVGGGGTTAAAAGAVAAASVTGGAVCPEVRIGDAGVAALGAALACNRALRELNLAGCRCGELGGAALLESLQQNTTLQILDLSGDGNAATSTSAAAMAGLRTTGRFGPCHSNHAAGEGAAGEEGAGEDSNGGGWGRTLGASTTFAAAAAVASATAASAAATGVDDAAATCLFTALQVNSGLRVLRLRGAAGLTIRSIRAASEMLRCNNTLLELDLSNSSFTPVDDAGAAIAMSAILQPHYTSSATVAGGQKQSQSFLLPLPRPASLRALPSSPSASLAAVPSHSSLKALPHSHSHPVAIMAAHAHGLRQSLSDNYSHALNHLAHLLPTHQHPNPYHQPEHREPHQKLPHGGSAPATPAAAASAGVESADLPGGLHQTSSFATSGGLPSVTVVGGLGCGGGSPSLGLGGGSGSESQEAVEVFGVLWSALARGLAVNKRLRVLRLAYCGLGAVGVAALAPALMQNVTLQELDLVGLPAAAVRTHLADVIARAAANLATAATGALVAGASATSLSLPSAAVAPTDVASSNGAGSGLVSLRVTDESYEDLDLMAAAKVTSRAAEEAAAVLEEARRAPGRAMEAAGSGARGWLLQGGRSSGRAEEEGLVLSGPSGVRGPERRWWHRWR